MRDAVVIDGGVRRRRRPQCETLPGGGIIAGKAAAPLGGTGVVVEVVVAAAYGAPVEQGRVTHVGELVEHPVQRFRLARPGAEDPGDAIGQPVRMAGPAAAPGVFRLLALEIPRDDVPNVSAEDIVVWDAEGGEEGDLAEQLGVPEFTGGWGLTGGNVELYHKAKTTADVHGRDREIGLVVGIATCSILAHGHPARQVARLDAAVHCGLGRVQDVELVVRIECGTEHLVAAPADDQECVAGEVGIDGHEVVAERPVETGGGAAVSTSICWFRLTCSAFTSTRASASTA